MNTGKKTPEAVERFFRVLYDTGNIGKASKAAGVDYESTRRWRVDDPEFAKRFNEVMESRNDDMEEEAHRRGFLGVKKPVIYKGELCFTVNETTGEREPLVTIEHSDNLALALLKANRPKKFRDTLEVTGTLNIAEKILAARKRVGRG